MIRGIRFSVRTGEQCGAGLGRPPEDALAKVLALAQKYGVNRATQNKWPGITFVEFRVRTEEDLATVILHASEISYEVRR